MEGLVKQVFEVLGALLLALILYRIFFVGDNCLVHRICDAMTEPISRNYYEYIMLPRDVSNTDASSGDAISTAHYDSTVHNILDASAIKYSVVVD